MIAGCVECELKLIIAAAAVYYMLYFFNKRMKQS